MAPVAALIRLARLSNAPTVASQCLAGAAIGAVAFGHESIAWIALVRSIGVTLLVYTGGMILNDVLDEPVDRVERPGRPIPSGAIGRSGAAGAAVACLGAALGLAWWFGHATEAKFVTGLVLATVLYDVLHLLTGGTTLLLGTCRGLVYLVAGMAQSAATVGADERDAMLPMAVFVGLYVTVFSVVARREAEPEPDAPVRFRCDRCGSREIDGRATCASCGNAFDRATGLGLVGHHRAAAWTRGPWLEWLGLVPLLGVLAAAAPRSPDTLAIAVALPAALMLMGWTAAAGRRARAGGANVGPAVGMWIAAIALVDATALLAIGPWWLAFGSLACFALARMLARRIAPS